MEDFEKSFKGVEYSVYYILEDLKSESFLAGEATPQDKSIE
jgi:hypothetical protein